MAIMMDGKKTADAVLEEVKREREALGGELRLAAVLVGGDPVSQKFIERKKEIARSLDIYVRMYPFDENISGTELRKRLKEIVHEERNNGVIIQLPLPKRLNAQDILNAVVPEKDADVLSARAVGDFAVGKSKIMPPVAGAVKTLLEAYGISLQNKKIVIFGAGNLVGKPVSLWFLREKIPFQMIEEGIPDPAPVSREADIIISGIGKPGYITSEFVKEGAAVIDAGTSEAGGKIMGDVDFNSVSKKAGFITPVPGGVGPVTIAMLFKNLVTLAKSRQ